MKNSINPCVIGLGKLGLPLAAVIAECGFQTVGFDINKELVSDILGKNLNFHEPQLLEILNNNSRFMKFTADYSDTRESNIFFIIVPTPSDRSGAFDSSVLVSVLNDLLDSFVGLTGERTLVIVSTVMPGTCDEVFKPIISKWSESNRKLNVKLLYSPEFIALGTVIQNLKNPDMTLIGCDESEDATIFLEIMEKVTSASGNVQILNLKEAEVVKILVNCFVTMKISFANFIGEISINFQGIDSQSIAQALGMDSRIGNKYLRPGLGFAGPCFPRDNRALIRFSETLNLRASLAIATDEINSRQPESVIKQIFNLSPKAKIIGIVGLTYKADTKVIEESQTLKIADRLISLGVITKLFDPLIEPKDLPDYGHNLVRSLDELNECDLVVIAKDFEHLIHSQMDPLLRTLVV
jgi:UDPglucose 6-dehydrogenase